MVGDDSQCEVRRDMTGQGKNGTLATHRTKAEAVYTFLREEILSGALEPGQRLTLAALSERLGTSMVPVREALMRLEREGLVEATPYRDIRVASMSIADMVELFGVRATLEGYAIRLAVQNEGQLIADHLEQINRSFERAAEDKDFSEVNNLNWEFHRFILDRAHNFHLRRFLEDIWSKCVRYRAGFRLIPGRDLSAVVEHDEIISAIREGTLDDVEKACRSHIEKAGLEMKSYLEAEEQKAQAR
ncbi:GntR family transcriptional regulator [Hoeflea sp. CAU 1731]